MTHFGEAIHDGEDGVVAVANHGESSDEVYGCIPTVWRGWGVVGVGR